MDKPQVGQLVYVGGCVGKITKIKNDIVTVYGVYHYYDPDMDNENSLGLSEPWTFHYHLEDFKLKSKFNSNCWDVDKINHILI